MPRLKRPTAIPYGPSTSLEPAESASPSTAHGGALGMLYSNQYAPCTDCGEPTKASKYDSFGFYNHFWINLCDKCAERHRRATRCPNCGQPIIPKEDK